MLNFTLGSKFTDEKEPVVITGVVCVVFVDKNEARGPGSTGIELEDGFNTEVAGGISSVCGFVGRTAIGNDSVEAATLFEIDRLKAAANRAFCTVAFGVPSPSCRQLEFGLRPSILCASGGRSPHEGNVLTSSKFEAAVWKLNWLVRFGNMHEC